VQAHVGQETLHAYYLEDSREQLVEAAGKLEAAGLAFTSHIHVGQAAEVIVKLADELKVDLLFIGSHGRGSIASALMGSVSRRVLHLAHCPVLVVK
jgi:nucleotide-binding universal stress UspA family protein